MMNACFSLPFAHEALLRRLRRAREAEMEAEFVKLEREALQVRH